MRWLGGIPVNRSSANNLVQQTIDAFNANDELVVTIPPRVPAPASKMEDWLIVFALGAKGAHCAGFSGLQAQNRWLRPNVLSHRRR